jgi:chromosome segregation ATPase
MTTSDQSHQPAHIVDDVEVVKTLEQRGFHGLDSLSLEELELLAERKRKQLHLEATEKKARLESEITSIGQQIKELQAKKVTLETQLRDLAKSPGLASSSGGERTTRRSPRKPRNPAETQLPSTPEA